jgi:hypothetical protein
MKKDNKRLEKPTNKSKENYKRDKLSENIIYNKVEFN